MVPSSAQDQRRQQRWARALEASLRTLATTGGEAAKQAYGWHAAAEAAAAKLRALQRAYHHVAVGVEERPQSGPGRPSHQQPRVINARRSGLQLTLPARAEVIARKTPEAGCFVRLTHGPTAGEMAHRAGDVLRADKAPHGREQNCGVLQAPLMVNRLFLQKPERMEALGLVCLLALLIWRFMARSLRLHVEMTGHAWPGGDQQETTRPTACMRMTQCTAVMGLQVGPQRQLAQARSAVQQPSLAALGVPTACVTGASGG
jgi:hypothetical protein